MQLFRCAKATAVALAMLAMLGVNAGFGQSAVNGSVGPATLPPISVQTTAVCGTTDGPIGPASGVLPAWPHNFSVQNPCFSLTPGVISTPQYYVSLNWNGQDSVAAGLSLIPGSGDERVARATPHCSAPSGPVTINIGW